MTSLSSSDVIAIASGIVAICALATSFWQARLSRKHNEISVRPHLLIHYYIESQIPLTIEIKNVGLGPAIIKSVNACFGHVCFAIHSAPTMLRMIKLLIPENPDFTYKCELFSQYSVIAPGESIKWLILTSKTDQEGVFKAINSNLNSFKIHIQYQCMYGNNFSLGESTESCNT